MAHWKFRVTCPHCGHSTTVVQTLKDDADAYIATCSENSGGCGKKFAYEARQTSVVLRTFTLSESEGRAQQ